MAICDYCDQEMTTAESCSVEVVHQGLLILRLPRYGEEERFMGWGWLKWRKSHPCKDCGVSPGGAHHLGCDVAECPACGRQLITCGCRFDEDPPDDTDDYEDEDEDEEDDAWDPVAS